MMIFWLGIEISKGFTIVTILYYDVAVTRQISSSFQDHLVELCRYHLEIWPSNLINPFFIWFIVFELT
jgi:hypothetical protein